LTNEKRQELQHRSNILISFKSAKESIMYTLDEGKNKIFNAAGQVNQPVPDDKDL
jgi:hypothetical protein